MYISTTRLSSGGIQVIDPNPDALNKVQPAFLNHCDSDSAEQHHSLLFAKKTEASLRSILHPEKTNFKHKPPEQND